MRRGLFILTMFLVVAMSDRDAHAGKFGTEYGYQHLQDLAAKGPKGEALALGYATQKHWFILPYKLTGAYALAVKGSGRDLNGRPLDVYHQLSQEKIEQMQRAGELPNPLPPHRTRMIDYIMSYVLWWCIPVSLAFIGLFSMLGIGSRTRDETRSA